MARLKDKVDCERVIRAAGVFDLSFYCPDPFAYALEDEVFTITKAEKHLSHEALEISHQGLSISSKEVL